MAESSATTSGRTPAASRPSHASGVGPATYAWTSTMVHVGDELQVPSAPCSRRCPPMNVRPSRPTSRERAATVVPRERVALSLCSVCRPGRAPDCRRVGRQARRHACPRLTSASCRGTDRALPDRTRDWWCAAAEVDAVPSGATSRPDRVPVPDRPQRRRNLRHGTARVPADHGSTQPAPDRSRTGACPGSGARGLRGLDASPACPGRAGERESSSRSAAPPRVKAARRSLRQHCRQPCAWPRPASPGSRRRSRSPSSTMSRHDGRIHAFGDALRRSAAAATTVGYARLAPITFAGRAIGVFTLLVGMQCAYRRSVPPRGRGSGPS